MKEKTGVSNRRYMITKNSILMLVLLVVIFLAVWAWFSSTAEDASASGVSVKTECYGVEVALPEADGSYPQDAFVTPDDPSSGNANWKSALDLSTNESLARLLEKDITGDGLNFIIPSFVDQGKGNEKLVNYSGNWSTAEANNGYLSIDFYLRSQVNNFYVTNASYVKHQSALTGANVVNKADTYGNFSKDGVVGAVRTSIVYDGCVQTAPTADVPLPAATGDKSCKLLWIPRPDLYLNTTNGIGLWTLQTGILESQNADYGTYTHKYLKPVTAYSDGSAAGVADAVADNAVASKVSAEDTGYSDGATYYPTLGQDIAIGSETTAEKVTFTTGDYYVYKYTMNIWIEGEDKEARRAFNGGGFEVHLAFGIK